jgi:heme exporter protein C
MSWRRVGLLGPITVVALGTTALFALVIAPDDSFQGDKARLLYVHVPTAWIAYLAFFVTALASALWLWPRTRRAGWDHLASASAEFGVVCTALTLFVGSVWGKAVWGTWWQWEARLTTTAVLFFLYLGYLVLRRLGGAGAQRRNAIAALIAFVDVPIVHFSVTWWTSLHQEGSVFNDRMDVNINDGRMAFTLWLSVASFTLLYAWCCAVRMRVLVSEAEAADRALDDAIAERARAAANMSASLPPVAGAPPVQASS